MSMTLRSQEKASGSSLMEKIMQYSPGSRAPVTSTEEACGPPVMSDPILGGSPVLIGAPGSRPSEYSELIQLIKQLQSSVDDHKQTMTAEIKKLHESQKEFQAHVDERITTLGNSMKESMKESIKQCMDDMTKYVDGEVGRICSQLNDVQDRVTAVEAKQTPDYDPEVSVIMSKVPMTPNEDIQKVAEKIIHEDLSLPDVQVVRATRLGQRNQNQQPGQRVAPPLVKVQLRDLEAKKRVLRNKKSLQNSPNYANVFIRSSKPHMERVMDMNCRTILELLGPQGSNMIVSGSGRIVKKTAPNNGVN